MYICSYVILTYYCETSLVHMVNQLRSSWIDFCTNNVILVQLSPRWAVLFWQGGHPGARTHRSALAAIGWESWSDANRLLVFQQVRSTEAIGFCQTRTHTHGLNVSQYLLYQLILADIRPVCTELNLVQPYSTASSETYYFCAPATYRFCPPPSFWLDSEVEAVDQWTHLWASTQWAHEHSADWLLVLLLPHLVWSLLHRGFITSAFRLSTSCSIHLLTTP